MTRLNLNTNKVIPDYNLPIYEWANGEDLPDDVTVAAIETSFSAQNVLQYAKRLSMLVIIFTKFADGRGFSLARQLNEAKDFKVILCAKGPLIPDQRLFLHDSGFNEVWLNHAQYLRQNPKRWLAPAQINAYRQSCIKQISEEQN